jgi:hypothetical protein
MTLGLRGGDRLGTAGAPEQSADVGGFSGQVPIGSRVLEFFRFHSARDVGNREGKTLCGFHAGKVVSPVLDRLDPALLYVSEAYFPRAELPEQKANRRQRLPQCFLDKKPR